MKTQIASSSKKVDKYKTVRHGVKCAVLALIVIALAAQALLDYVLYNRVIYSNNGDQSVITSLISQSVHDGLKTAPVEPLSATVYFPEAKFYVPAGSAPFSELQYRYVPAFEGTGSELDVTTKQAISVAESRMWGALANSSSVRGASQTAVFNQVPALQSCARGVHVLFDAKSGAQYGLNLQATRQLADGRTLYIYTEPKATCQTGFASLIAQLKQAESF